LSPGSLGILGDHDSMDAFEVFLDDLLSNTALLFCYREEHLESKIITLVTEAKAKMGKGDKKGN
jgi:hypothetical protein